MRDTSCAQPRPIDPVTESNHRIANQLAMLVTFAQREAAKLGQRADVVRRDDAVAVIKGLGAKVAAVSTLHRALAANARSGDVDLACVLEQTVQPLKELYGERLRVEMSIAAGCRVTSDHACALALAFAEIVTNAMKYAHPSGVPVEMSVVGAATADGRIVLEISDYGIGLPEDSDPQRDSGVGMKMIRYMIDAACGDLTTTSTELGLTLSITLPQRRPAV
ncbi:MAG: sensor histidine kinase [Rhodospirillaceae bacterium]